MNMSEVVLLSEAPPPVHPVDSGASNNWIEVENALGSALPADYKWLINTYGSGDFCDLLVVLSPFSGAEQRNLLMQVRHILEYYRLGPPERCSFPCFPDSGGLLPVARDFNGGDLFWLTIGTPDQWSLIHYNWDGWVHESHSMPLVEFLVEWIAGRLPDSFFGSGNNPYIIRRDPVFCPFGQVRVRRPCDR